MNYNLLEERWIPVLMNDGEFRRVGILEALTGAGRIRCIAASNPMDGVAILRLLLALLYWCKGSPPDGAEANLTAPLPPEWFSRLSANKDCFNLLGEGKRFYQCGKNPDSTANYLNQETPTGTNFWHFRHAADNRDGLCLACCALGLVRLPAFATSAGRGKSPGVNAKPPYYVISFGRSLAETLRLSWRQASAVGTPSWDASDLRLPPSGEIPLLTGLTWVPRRVWLSDPEAPEAPCIACGKKALLVRKIAYEGVGSTKTDAAWRDPHVIGAPDEILKPGDALGSPNAAADQWARVMAGLLADHKASPARKLWVVGFATVQNDKYLEAVERFYPSTPPPDDADRLLQEIDKWRKEGKSLPRKAAGGKKHSDVAAMVESVRPHVETRVSSLADKLTSGVPDAWQRAGAEYRPMMEAVARSAFPGFTTAAIEKRNQIANLCPNMKEKAPSPGKRPKRTDRKGTK